MRSISLFFLLAVLLYIGAEAKNINANKPTGLKKRLIFGGDGVDGFPDPNDDPFYKIPANIQSYSPGAVIASRPVNTTIDEKDVGSSYQILYRTSDTQNDADVTVGTVWSPKNPTNPAKLFSFQVFEDATQLDCAPSWAFINGSSSKNTITTTIDAPAYIQWALERGYHVVAPDHLGSKSTFIAGFAEGRAVLDGVRAAIKFGKLPANTPTAMAGYSGGASSTAWAANLAENYASELNIIGAVHGGTPVDTRGIYEFLLGGPFAGFAGAGLSGLSRAYPDLNEYIQSIVTEQGKKDLATIVKRNECLINIVFDGAFKNYSKETILKTNPLDEPIPKRILAIESLLSNVSSVGVNVPRFPTFQFHAQNDEVVPRDEHEQFIEQQCQAGAKISYSVVPLVDHVTGVVASIPGALKALGQIYDGTLDTSKCGVQPKENFASIRPDSQEAKSILGDLMANRLSMFNGYKTPLGRIQW